jgi:hypothetical protein
MSEHPINSKINISQDKLDSVRDSVRKELYSSGDPQEFVVDLNNLADMLVLLVGKYQRAYYLTLVCLTLLLACLVLLVHAAFAVDRLQTNQTALQSEVKKTGAKVDETKERVNATASAVPRVQMDPDTGETQVVLPVVPILSDTP